MGRLGDTLAGAGVGVNRFNENVDAAYETGQRQAQNAQIAAYRLNALRQQAQHNYDQEQAAIGMPNEVLPAPQMMEGMQRPWNEPQPPPPPPITAGLSRNPYETQRAPTPQQESLPPTVVVPPGFTQPPSKPGKPVTPPKKTPYGANGRGIDFSFAPPLGGVGNAVRPSQSDVRTFDQQTNPEPEVKPLAPDTSSRTAIPPAPTVAATNFSGQGVVPTTPTVPDTAQAAIRAASDRFGVPYDVALALARHESSLNHGQSHINRNGTNDFGLFQINSVNAPQGGPGWEDPRLDINNNAVMGVGMFASSLHKAQEMNGTTGMPPTQADYKLAYQFYNGGARGYNSPEAIANSDRFIAQLYPQKHTWDTAQTGSQGGAMPFAPPATTPAVGAAPVALAPGTPHAGSYDESRAAPAVSPEMPALTHNLPKGVEFAGGQPDGQQHYNFYDQLANAQTRMAKIHMLNGDPDRAQGAIAQANMARLEQYNILSQQALHAARRGDPTRLLSLMNFYDPGAGYSLRGLNDGHVQVLSNGKPLGAMSEDEFLNSAQLMVSKAYYDKMLDLRMKLAEKQAEQGYQYQREAGVADIKGRWDVEQARQFAIGKGLTPTVDSANNAVYAHGMGPDGRAHLYLVKPGMPIGNNTKFLTAPTLQEIQ